MKLSINKVSLAWVVLTIIVAVVRLFVGEDQIILHWNITGQADDYGPKYLILLLPLISLLIFLMLYSYSKNPYKMNTRARIVQNEHNTELLCRYYSIVQLLVTTLLLYLTIAIAGYVPMYVFLICLPIIGVAIYSVYTKHKLSHSQR
ncbi:DUF1648 domain-containing protein [Hoylesella nanceiensis]|uniref:DUF1648 domain-containing protein n=1 Tax=Hoylesella nanceiensis TaxID=425941 RepID=UPI00036AC06E|nr:DUF1648 domain-containing protein [Hoylesella nanceiensis]